ncbi:hypothetical protein KIN20_021751 [Parelaphostrongylus tenuis]|uniref:Uncharacterized protein n=1 Tax=Parelaphostrongylus tenuis TaxID=148309 RepID=A0AAD5MUL5_PARTN|nr:hypothetical protein KIN20_021751 [Parelaphostrongylus tenuis]
MSCIADDITAPESLTCAINMSSIIEGRSPLLASKEMKTTGDVGMISLKERLAALHESVESWQSRVKKDELLLRRNSLSCRINRFPSCSKGGQKNEEKVEISSVTPMSKQCLMLDLDKGLDSFFLKTTFDDKTATTKDNEIDLNSIQETDILSIKKRPRLKKSGKGHSVVSDRLATINIDTVNIEEDIRDSLVTPVIFDEGGPIATSAQQGLQDGPADDDELVGERFRSCAELALVTQSTGSDCIFIIT